MKFELFIPVKPYHLNQGWGNPSAFYTSLGLNGHNGLDLDTYHSQPIYAAHEGICFPEIDNNGGNGIVLRTANKYDYEGKQVYFKTIYWHLIKADAVVRTGDKVKVGDLIGYADSTGVSTGDHLHFGLKPQEWNEVDWTWYNVDQKNGYLGAIDPTPYLNGFYAEDAPKVFSLYNQIIFTLKTLYTKLGGIIK